MHQFKSRLDLWLATSIYGSAVVSLLAAIYVMHITPGIAAFLLVFFMFVIGCVLPVWLVTSTHYRVAASTLTVRSGPFKWVVELDEIERVEKSNNPISSPALSLDRLAITYGNGKPLPVAPRDKEGFIQALGIKQS